MADVEVTSLILYGYAIPVVDIGRAVTEDESSQIDYGVYAKDTTAPEAQDITLAQGVADWMVYRYGSPKARPTLTIVNRFPTQMNRDVTDRIALTFARLSISAKQMLIRSVTTTVSEKGLLWTTTYELEEAPTSTDLFTIGGTAAQGIGGSGILGR